MNNNFFIDRAKADLGAGFTVKSLNEIIRSAQMNIQTGSSDGVDGLLAAILMSQAKCNGNYRAYPFEIGAGKVQQILPQNDSRVGLMVSISTITTVPVAGVLLEAGPMNAEDATGDNINRSIQINSAIQTIMDFNVSATNPITLVSCNNIAVRGVIFEAVQS